jgi:hypothetical protein
MIFSVGEILGFEEIYEAFYKKKEEPLKLSKSLDLDSDAVVEKSNLIVSPRSLFKSVKRNVSCIALSLGAEATFMSKEDFISTFGLSLQGDQFD